MAVTPWRLPPGSPRVLRRTQGQATRATHETLVVDGAPAVIVVRAWRPAPARRRQPDVRAAGTSARCAGVPVVVQGMIVG